MSHPPAEAPLCPQCQSTEAAYFDLSCLKCLQRLVNPKTNISQIFAVMRQWNPHTQRSIKFLVQQVTNKAIVVVYNGQQLMVLKWPAS